MVMLYAMVMLEPSQEVRYGDVNTITGGTLWLCCTLW